MNHGRTVAISSALLATVSLAVSLSDWEGIMAVISLFALSFGIVASKHCSARTNVFILIASFTSFVASVLSVTVFSEESIVDAGVLTRVQWFVLMALVHVTPLAPLTMASFVIIASITRASYNWVLIGGLSPFIAMGMLVPGYVAEYVFQDMNVDVWMTDNGYILYGLLIAAAVMFVFSLYVSQLLRKKGLVVTNKGLEVLS